MTRRLAYKNTHTKHARAGEPEHERAGEPDDYRRHASELESRTKPVDQKQIEQAISQANDEYDKVKKNLQKLVNRLETPRDIQRGNKEKSPVRLPSKPKRPERTYLKTPPLPNVPSL